MCVCVCMYKMSSEAKTAAKERKITAETYSNTKTHAIRVCRKLADEDYVISIKMIDLQNHLCHQNLWYVAMKKIKSFCGTKYLTKEEVQKYKRKKVNGLMTIKVYTSIKILLLN